MSNQISGYTIYLVLVVIIKFLFAFFALNYQYLAFGKGEEERKSNKKAQWYLYWKERTEFIFIFMMALLCMYLFSPFSKGKNIAIDEHTRILLFVYGIIIFVTADWKLFFHEAKWFKYIQKNM